ncbi:MAG TPA: hypothetical protein ENG03_06175 [Thioploca sp.]|nr:MAG: hypothetical protein DRR19_22965 [Gammaproteobacteria bacterium]HDN26671.1 hypothetical protein [Thioploca sp.]
MLGIPNPPYQACIDKRIILGIPAAIVNVAHPTELPSAFGDDTKAPMGLKKNAIMHSLKANAIPFIKRRENTAAFNRDILKHH